MTYTSGGNIQASDYNNFATAAANIGPVFNIGSSDYGYGQLSNGQTTIQTVSVTNAPTGLVTAAQWNIIITAVNSSRKHQAGAAYANILTVGANPAQNTGLSTDGVIYASVDQSGTIVPLTTLIADSVNNRRNADSQGTTTTATSTNNSGWSDYLTFTNQISFANDNQARYFFNAGGQIGISLAHGPSTPNTINPLIQDLCSELGTIWLSSGTCTLAGSNYTGLTQVGGTAARQTINTGLSFYALTGSNQQGVRQGSDVSYRVYSSSFLTINYRYNSPTVTITATIDEVFTSGTGTTVGTPTTCSISVRNPETTFLTNSWGTPAVTQSITRA